MEKEFVPYDLALKLKEIGFANCSKKSKKNYENI